MARVAAPVYFKQELFGDSAGKVAYCGVLQEAIEAKCPRLRVSGRAPADLHIPAAGPME